MSRSQNLAIVVVSLIAFIVLLAVAPTGGTEPTPYGGDQRDGLVETAVMFEDTSTHYPTGAEYAQAVYASQGIDISTDLATDSYVSTEGPVVGDIVVGHGYVGILTGETTAMGVALDGGPVQEVRVTDEEIRRVDW